MNEAELNKVIDKRIAASLRMLDERFRIGGSHAHAASMRIVADKLEQQEEPVKIRLQVGQKFKRRDGVYEWHLAYNRPGSKYTAYRHDEAIVDDFPNAVRYRVDGVTADELGIDEWIPVE